MMGEFKGWFVGVAAEAIAAALFARCGLKVSVQYGANQPEYDLMIDRDGDMLKVSVKGSNDGGWGLTQSLIKNANYHGAVDKWLSRHKSKTIFCLVQFKDVELLEMPRVYLATPIEIAEQLKQSASNRGDTILYEYQVWGTRAFAAGTIDAIPEHWKFSADRIGELFELA